MKLPESLRELLRELSALLAGFKLALILIGWFGFGSVAKWVLEQWYPFTRWVWDAFAIALSFPELPIAVKDSLTALVFFLPLGITAFFWPSGSTTSTASNRIRIIAIVLGLVLLLVVSKDAISEIYSNPGGIEQ